MKYQESDIKHERGTYWVLDTGNSYAVMKNGVTHSTSDSEYARNADGLSIAIARCNYLARVQCVDCGTKHATVHALDKHRAERH